MNTRHRWTAAVILFTLVAASCFAAQGCARDEPEQVSAVRLEEVDGGVGYYARFKHALPSDRSYFPIATWLMAALDQHRVELDKAAGVNLYVGVADPEGSNLALLPANGMRALIQVEELTRFTDIGSETAGWLLGDELDMCCGPPGFLEGNGYDMLTSRDSSLPVDGRLRYTNYGKGVLFWEGDADAARFVNLPFLGLVSDDVYWFTDPNERSTPGYRVAASYGDTVKRMRDLDSRDGRRKPIWNLVETGWPFTDSASQGGRAIEPEEIRAAVWHSLIAGARGIIYFDHQFGGPCTDEVLRGRCYPANLEMVKSVNQQIRRLAPVLNSPTVTAGHSASPDIRTMVKWNGSSLYVFAGSTGSDSTATVTIPCVGDAMATVLGERRTVRVSSGAFSDRFANGNAIHVYRIDGGSTCDLPID